MNLQTLELLTFIFHYLRWQIYCGNKNKNKFNIFHGKSGYENERLQVLWSQVVNFKIEIPTAIFTIYPSVFFSGVLLVKGTTNIEAKEKFLQTDEL